MRRCRNSTYSAANVKLALEGNPFNRHLSFPPLVFVLLFAVTSLTVTAS